MTNPVDNVWWPRFSEHEYERRRRRVREAMAERDLDVLLVYGSPIYFGTDPGSPNLAYLAGYAPGCHGYLVFPRAGAPTLLVYVPNHLENAQAISVVEDVRAGNDLIGSAVARLRDLDEMPERIGIVGNFGFSGSSIPVEHHRALNEHLPDSTFQVVTEWYEDLRLLKSPEEMAFMEAAASICDQAHQALREMLHPGVSDVALQNEVFRVVHELGGRLPFSHVGSTSMGNPTLRYPSFYPVNRLVEPGDVVLTEIAAGTGGYFGKIYGTLIVGEPTPEYLEMLEIAAGIYHDIYSNLKSGMPARQIDDVLPGRTESAGYVSLSYISGWSTYNTRPAKTTTASEADRNLILRPGHCLNLAGWVVSSDRSHGVWIGDTAVVTERGLSPLHRYPVSDLNNIILTQ